MRKRGLLLAFVLVLAGVEFAAAQSQPAVLPVNTGGDPTRGTILGRVTGPSGTAQVGVPVTVTSRDGRFSQKVETQAGGSFSLPRLAPGVYSVEVLLPTFLPFWKAPIQVLPGAQVLLDINLRALADAVDVSWPEDPAGARDDWKWVLRSGAASRPILRFLEEDPAAGGSGPEGGVGKPLHGTVQFVAGSDSRGFASDPGLRTSFDMEYGTGGPDTLGVAGSAGWEQGTPAAAFRAAWNRRFGDQADTTFSTAVRQVFLPGEYWRSIGGSGEIAGERLQSVTLGYAQESAPSTRLRMRYGAYVDTVSIGDRMTRWNPFGQVTYAYSDSTRLVFSYAGAAPRVLPSETDYRQQKSEQWLAIPQMSSGADLHPVLEEGSHLEAAWEQQWGTRYRAQAGVFYDSLSDVALSMTGGQSAGFFPGLLRDPFSNRYFLSGGNYSGPGARASFAAMLSDHSDVIVGYSYAEGLQAVSGNLVAESPQALRAMMQADRGHSFSVKVSTKVPGVDTRVITSYRWLPGNSVLAPDPYDQSLGRAEPYMNVVFLQPLPSPNILPGQFEAVLDIRNLLAEGYLLVQTPEGGRSLLYPAARAFRGGFNFIF